MENFFGGLVADKSSKLKGIGRNPTAIGNLGNSAEIIQELMSLPTEISADELINLHEQLGQMKGENEIADQILSIQGELLNAAVDRHGKNIKWADVTMKADQRVRTMEAGRQQAVARYMLGAATTQAEVDGYSKAYEMSAEIFG